MTTSAGGGFPFQNHYAKGVFASLPDGMTINEDVMQEFLDPPNSEYEWFAQKVWDQVAVALENDNAVSQEDYDAMQNAFNSARDSMVNWTDLRDPNTNDPNKGWGNYFVRQEDAIKFKNGMGTFGQDAFRSIQSVKSIAARLGPAVADGTAAALSDLAGALSEYAGCMALELEAAQDHVAVTDLLNRVNKGVTNPWSPAVTPTNIGDMLIGTHRLPQAPDPPDAEFWKHLDAKSESTPDDATPWESDSGGEGGGDIGR